MASSCVTLANYLCNRCPEPQLGRISSVAFVQKGIPVVDASQNQTWVDLICNSYAVIIPDVRGTYDGGTAVEGPGYGRVPNRRQSANHSVSYMHLYSCENVDFYNELNNSTAYELWYTNGIKLWRSTQPVMVNAMAPITDDTAANIEWSVTVTWSNKNLSTCLDTPAIFDSCDSIEKYLECLTCNPIVIGC